MTLEIYDVLGRKVRTLVAEQKTAGSYQQQWDGRADDDELVASGVYFYSMKVEKFREIKKMVLLR